MDETQLRQRFCRALNQLWMRGMLVGADGMLCCEVHRRRYLVTPTGLRRVDLQPDELICVDIGGENVQGGEGIPPADWQPHRDVYQAHVDPAGVILGASALIEPANVLALYHKQGGQDRLELNKGDSIPVVDGQNDRLIRQTLSESTEALLTGRGLFVAATDLPGLLNRIERIDLAAAVQRAKGG